MPKEKEQLTRSQREELRAIFTLGLMAILITLRISQTPVVVTLPRAPFLLVFDKENFKLTLAYSNED